jgi:hypothetical protein
MNKVSSIVGIYFLMLATLRGRLAGANLNPKTNAISTALRSI